jgi:predicted chitinase
MRYYEIANTASLEILDEGWVDKAAKAARWAATGATAAALGYVAGDITKPPSRDIQQTPASIAQQMDYANNTAYDEPAGPSMAPTTSPRPKPRPADLTAKPAQAYIGTIQTPGPDTARPKPRPADLTDKSTQADAVDVQTPGPDTVRPRTRPDSGPGEPPAPTQAEVVSNLANADDTVKVTNVSDNKDIENLLIKMATEAGIVGTELQAFLAQAYHESHNFTSTVEQLYGKSKNYFKRAYENPRAARILGNTKPGDGEKYKGRGYLQITGRYNYGEAAKALGLPLLEQPELLEDTKIAAAVSVWFWKWRVRARMSGNWDNVQKVTDIVNGGDTAVEDRDELFKAYGHMKSLKREIKRPD